jgi:hypothetical protein
VILACPISDAEQAAAQLIRFLLVEILAGTLPEQTINMIFMYSLELTYNKQMKFDKGAESRTAPGRQASKGRTLGVRALTRLALRWSRSAEWESLDAVELRSWRLFARTEACDAWLIAWPIGGTIQLHDHGESSGAIVVVSGTLEETRIKRNVAGAYEPTRRTLLAGGVPGSFSQHEIHDVTNAGPAAALSLHVYSPRLTTMTFYELLGDKVVVRTREEVADDEPEARPRAACYEAASEVAWA